VTSLYMMFDNHSFGRFFSNRCKQLATYEGNRWAYWYPSDDTIQYLYESYPDNISPIQGVENEHFMVWMRYVAINSKSYTFFQKFWCITYLMRAHSISVMLADTGGCGT
jgi:hypothetical protein